MANIVRCILPDGVKRFKPFTVSDYRDFLLVRNDMNTKTPEEQINVINELMEDYFPDVPERLRPYVFLQVFTSSIGKTKIPIAYECSECKASKKTLLNLQQAGLNHPEVSVAGIKIKFKFPRKNTESVVSLIKDNIYQVSDSSTTYLWDDLSDEDKVSVVDALDAESIDKVIQMMKPLSFTLKLGCCKPTTIVYESIVDLFKLLIHPDEIFTFYQINHVMAKNHYDLSSIMNMIPIERSIALSLIEKDLKK